MRLESGDHRGRWLAWPSCVICRGAPPWRGTVQTCTGLEFACTSTDCTWNATVCPSGEICGSPMRLSSIRPLASKGRPWPKAMPVMPKVVTPKAMAAAAGSSRERRIQTIVAPGLAALPRSRESTAPPGPPAGGQAEGKSRGDYAVAGVAQNKHMGEGSGRHDRCQKRQAGGCGPRDQHQHAAQDFHRAGEEAE